MKTASYTLIPFTAFGQSNTVDGNYDGTSPHFNGDPVKAASYYTKGTGIQTGSWYLVGFEGTITFEGTLESDPLTDSYFEIADPITSLEIINPIEPPTITNTPLTENSSVNIEGNYTWIRARVTDFTAGAITKVSLGY